MQQRNIHTCRRVVFLVYAAAVMVLVAPYVSHPSPLSNRAAHAILAVVARALFLLWAVLTYYWAPSKLLATLQLPVALCLTAMAAQLEGRAVFGALGLPEVPFMLLLYGTTVAVVLFPVLGLRRAARLAKSLQGCCHSCGYDLRGNVSGRCPECGTGVESSTGASDDQKVRGQRAKPVSRR